MNPGLAPTVTPGVLRYVSNRLTLLFNDYLISSTNPTTHTSTIQNNIELGRGPTQSLQTYTKMSVIYSLSCLGVCLCGQSRHQSDRWAGAVYWSHSTIHVINSHINLAPIKSHINHITTTCFIWQIFPGKKSYQDLIRSYKMF